MSNHFVKFSAEYQLKEYVKSKWHDIGPEIGRELIALIKKVGRKDCGAPNCVIGEGQWCQCGVYWCQSHKGSISFCANSPKSQCRATICTRCADYCAECKQRDWCIDCNVGHECDHCVDCGKALQPLPKDDPSIRICWSCEGKRQRAALAAEDAEEAKEAEAEKNRQSKAPPKLGSAKNKVSLSSSPFVAVGGGAPAKKARVEKRKNDE